MIWRHAPWALGLLVSGAVLWASANGTADGYSIGLLRQHVWIVGTAWENGFATGAAATLAAACALGLLYSTRRK